MRVLIVSPVQALRTGLRMMLSISSNGSVQMASQGALDLDVSEARNLLEATRLDFTPDVLVLAGERALDELRHPGSFDLNNLAVLMLADQAPVVPAFLNTNLRAWGILPLEASAEELIAAIRALAEGLLVGDPGMMGQAIGQMFSVNTLTHSVSPEGKLEDLTDRELQVLQRLAEGLANKQISVLLGISEHTVKFHVSSIFSKLGVANRTEAVRLGLQRGLVSL